MKFNVTNVSTRSEKGARNVFLTEAGKLLKAGDSIACNRIDSGTWGLEKAGILKIEEGNFPTPPIFTDKPKAIEDDQTATAPKAEDVAVRRAEAEAMDKRIAAAKALDDAKVAAEVAAKAPPVVAPATDESHDSPVTDESHDSPAAGTTTASKKHRGSKF
mgnify:CR=1 FL=1